MLSMLYIQRKLYKWTATLSRVCLMRSRVFLSSPSHWVQFTDVLFESTLVTSAYFYSWTWRIELFDGKELEEAVRASWLMTMTSSWSASGSRGGSFWTVCRAAALIRAPYDKEPCVAHACAGADHAGVPGNKGPSKESWPTDWCQLCGAESSICQPGYIKYDKGDVKGHLLY